MIFFLACDNNLDLMCVFMASGGIGFSSSVSVDNGFGLRNKLRDGPLHNEKARGIFVQPIWLWLEKTCHISGTWGILHSAMPARPFSVSGLHVVDLSNKKASRRTERARAGNGETDYENLFFFFSGAQTGLGRPGEGKRRNKQEGPGFRVGTVGRDRDLPFWANKNGWVVEKKKSSQLKLF